MTHCRAPAEIDVAMSAHPLATVSKISAVKERNDYQTVKILQMESTPCGGVQEKGSKWSVQEIILQVLEADGKERNPPL